MQALDNQCKLIHDEEAAIGKIKAATRDDQKTTMGWRGTMISTSVDSDRSLAGR